MKQFADRLKELRKSKKLKQTDMAAFLNVTPRHYQDMEYGKINVPGLTLIALADYFDVSLDYLVGRSDEPGRR
jgi:transcriptional regulator with XRE-family HTH domain